MKKHNQTTLYRGNTKNQGEWLNYRKIGASAIHNLVEADRFQNGWIDLPNYSSPWILYKQLKKEYKPVFNDLMVDKMNFGHFAENFIQANFLSKMEAEGIEGFDKVTGSNEVVGNPAYPWATVTPDGWARIKETGEWIPLEYKTGDSFQWDNWKGETIPDKYYSQCQYLMAVLDKPYMFILGWINNRFTKVFKVEKDPEFISYMMGLAEKFWNENYLAGVEPGLIGSKVEADALGKVYQFSTVEVKEVPETEITAEEQEKFQAATAALKKLESTEKAFKIKLKKEMLEKGLNKINFAGGSAKFDKRGALRVKFI